MRYPLGITKSLSGSCVVSRHSLLPQVGAASAEMAVPASAAKAAMVAAIRRVKRTEEESIPCLLGARDMAPWSSPFRPTLVALRENRHSCSRQERISVRTCRLAVVPLELVGGFPRVPGQPRRRGHPPADRLAGGDQGAGSRGSGVTPSSHAARRGLHTRLPPGPCLGCGGDDGGTRRVRGGAGRGPAPDHR